MISEEEEKRIRLIETYKFEVRDKLETEKAKKFGIDKVFSFFNSKFGLWVLSAIFVSGGVKVYDDYKVKQENEKTRGEIIEKLDNEISYKFNKVIADLEGLKENGDAREMLMPMEGYAREFALNMDKGSSHENNFLYEEYKNWSLLALVVEQNRQINYLGKRDPELEVVIEHLNKLSQFFEGNGINYEDIGSIQEVIQENLVLSRWKSNRLFSY
jgi:hypothetical protein